MSSETPKRSAPSSGRTATMRVDHQPVRLPEFDQLHYTLNRKQNENVCTHHQFIQNRHHITVLLDEVKKIQRTAEILSFDAKLFAYLSGASTIGPISELLGKLINCSLQPFEFEALDILCDHIVQCFNSLQTLDSLDSHPEYAFDENAINSEIDKLKENVKSITTPTPEPDLDPVQISPQTQSTESSNRKSPDVFQWALVNAQMAPQVLESRVLLGKSISKAKHISELRNTVSALRRSVIDPPPFDVFSIPPTLIENSPYIQNARSTYKLAATLPALKEFLVTQKVRPILRTADELSNKLRKLSKQLDQSLAIDDQNSEEMEFPDPPELIEAKHRFLKAAKLASVHRCTPISRDLVEKLKKSKLFTPKVSAEEPSATSTGIKQMVDRADEVMNECTRLRNEETNLRLALEDRKDELFSLIQEAEMKSKFTKERIHQTMNIRKSDFQAFLGCPLCHNEHREVFLRLCKHTMCRKCFGDGLACPICTKTCEEGDVIPLFYQTEYLK